MRRLGVMAACVALPFAFSVNDAQAHHYHHHWKYHRHTTASVGPCMFTNGGRQICGPAVSARQGRQRHARRDRFEYAATKWHYAAERYPIGRTGRRYRVADASGRASVIGGRPSGCPHAYCGCGLRKYLGLSDTRLNLAWNWARLFPHVSGPSAGVAAVRHHHVMYIEGRAGNGEWLVRDYNSGGGLSRVHERSVRGYVFVNPHAMLARN
jgi:hypothetical protein